MTTDLATLGIAVDSTQVRRGVSDLDGLAAAGGRAEKSVQSLGGVVGSLARGMGVLTGALATVGISRLITETATLSQRYNEMGIVLNVVSRNAGLLKSDVDAVTKAVKDQGISMIESRSVMTRLIQAQIDLSKATELARLAQDAAVIGQINSSEALDRMIHGITSAQVEVLRGIGINVNFENSYKQLAQQMGVATSSLSEQQKMQARVNIVLEEATKLNGVYAASMENAGKQMRSTQRLAEDLKVKIGGLFDQTAMVAVKAYTDLLKDLDRTVEDMARSGELKDWSHRIAIEFAGLIDITRVFIGQFGIIGNLVATQFTNIKNGDFDKLTLGFANADKALKALWADGEKYQDQVNSRVIQENMLTEAVGRGAAAAQKKSEEETKGALGLKNRKSEQDKLNKAQQEALRIESEYIKLLEVERKQRQDLIAPYKEGAKQAADRLNSMQDEIAALKLVRDRQISMKQAVELTTIARLEEKKAKTTDSLVIKEIEAEISARRKVIDLIPEYEQLEKQSRNSANTVSQQWIQAARNIQTALSNSIFEFFNDGLDGMVRSLKSALLRMIAEAASLRFSESIGSLLLGGAGGSGGTGGQTVGLLASLLGAFGGAGGGIRTGGGVTTGAFSNAGGAGTAFIGGPGTAIGGSGMGVNATRGGGVGSSMMSMAAMAGPYGLIAAATIMAGMELNKKYGDYKVSGFNKFGMNGLNKTDPIAVIANQFGIKGPGEIIGKALFGRGPYKFRQQSIQGDISAGGLDGTITDVFKSKGGLLVKNKHKEFEKDIPSEIVRDIDKSIKSIYKSTGEFADNLGIDARSIDTFTKQIQLKSEKGKALDTEKVKEELDAFNEDLIKSFMPDIDNFKLTGETAGETFKRLNNELDALKTGVQNLGGSAAFAKELIMGMSIDARSAVVDIAGGIDKLLEKTQFFSENFLTPTEQIAPTIAMVNEEMAKLGFSSVTTKDQFRELVQSMEIPAETRNALLDIAPAFLQILDAAKQIKAEANDNLLTLAQEFAPDLVQGIQRDMANEVLGKFGVTVDTSREKVTELLTAFVKSGGLFSNMADDVMEAAAAWSDFQKTLPVKDTASQDPSKDPLKKVDPMQVLAGAYSTLQRSVDAERKKLTDKYNDELGKVNTSIDNLTGSVGKLKSLSDSLKNAVDQIQPLTRGQAKFELLSAINNAKRGIFPESNDLQKVLNVLSDSNSITDAKSSFEFAREQAKTSLLMQDLGDLTDNQLSVEEKMLVAAEKQRDDLNRNFQDQTLRLDSMLTKAQEQIDKLSGIDTKILSLSQALANFSKAYSAAGAAQIPEVVTPPPSAGNPKITNKEIVDYARAPGRTEMEIYNKAKEVGVSFEQYAKATGSNVEDLYAWAKKKGLPTFASGGYHQGGLRIVGEKGPELEYTGPSRIISNADVSKLGGNDDLSREIKALAEKVGKTQQSLEKVVAIFNKVIVDDKGGPALSIKQRTA